jgi:hypothetical protein
MGHSPHFYVAGTLPEFATESSIYSSSYLPASAYFMRSRDHEEEVSASPAPEKAAPSQAEPRKVSDVRSPRPGVHKPAAAAKPAAARPHFSRSSAQPRNRKPAPTGRPGQSTAAHAQNGARPTNGTRWGKPAPKNTNGKNKGAHAAASPAKRAGTNGAAPSRNGKSPAPAWKKPSVPAKHNGHSNGIKTAPKTTTAKRSLSRADARPVRGSSRKPTMTAKAGAGSGKRFGFTARPKQGTKKRG